MDFIKVFIVEDDPMVASINKRFTEKIAPFKVIGTSTTEDDALQKINELKPDLVLLDVYLPQGNGLSVLQNLRLSNQPVDVILITAAKDTATIYQTLRYGAIDYIIKPFDMERLEQALRNYLNLRKILNKSLDLNQEDLDKLNSFGDENTKANSELPPKGVHLLTLEQVVSYLLKQDRALSCQQIAAALNMSKITAWRYLEYLAAEKKVEVELEYGVGRPTKLYKVNVT